MPADGTLAAWSQPRTSARPASKAVLKSSRFRGREEYGRRRSWVRLGRSAMSASTSGLPESGHGWAIYEYTPFCNGPITASGRFPLILRPPCGDGAVTYRHIRIKLAATSTDESTLLVP